MASRSTQLTMDILARVRGQQDVQRMSSAIDSTGDAMDEAEGEAQRLDRAIDGVSDEIAELNRELVRTGDVELFGKIQDQRGALQQLQRMRKELGDVDDAASGLGRRIGDVLRGLPAQVQAGMVIGLVGAGTVAAPLIGGAVGAAVLGGVGAGGIIGGVAAAADHPEVQAAAESFMSTITGAFDELGDAFVHPVQDALAELGDAGSDLIDELEPAISDLAPVMSELAQGVGQAVRELGPGLTAALEESEPILRVLAQELPSLGEAVSDAFEAMAAESDGAILALRTIIELLEASIRWVGGLTATLSAVFEGIVRISAAASEAQASMLGWIPGIEAAEPPAANLRDTLNGVGESGMDAGGQIAGGMGQAEGATMDATSALQEYHDELRAQVDPVFAFMDAQRDLNQAQQGLIEAEDEFGRNSPEYEEALQRQTTAAMDLLGAAEGAAGEFDGELPDAMRETMRELGITEEQLDDTEDALRGAEDAASDLAGNYGMNIHTTYSQTGNPPPVGAAPVGSMMVPFQHGGPVVGPSGVDRVPAMLTSGEFVINKEATQRHGELLRAINRGQIGQGDLAMAAAGGDGAATAGTAQPPPVVFQGDGTRAMAMFIELFLTALRTSPEVRRRVAQTRGP